MATAGRFAGGRKGAYLGVFEWSNCARSSSMDYSSDEGAEVYLLWSDKMHIYMHIKK